MSYIRTKVYMTYIYYTELYMYKRVAILEYCRDMPEECEISLMPKLKSAESALFGG